MISKVNLIFGAVFLVVSVSGCSKHAQLEAPSEVQKTLYLNGDSDESKELEIPILNRGSENLLIKEVIGSCGCMSATFPPIVPPNTSAVISVRIAFGNWSPPSRKWRIIVHSNSFKNNLFPILVNAELHYKLTSSVDRLDFGTIPIDGKARRPLVIFAECKNKDSLSSKVFSILLPNGFVWKEIQTERYTEGQREFIQDEGEILLYSESNENKENLEYMTIKYKDNITKRIPLTWKTIHR